MDIVITTKPGRYRDVRLKYALRSLEYMPSSRVFVVGEMGSGFSNVVHIDSDGNDFSKLIKAASWFDMSERMVWMPDNCVLLEEFPVYARFVAAGRLYRRADEEQAMINTIRHLLENDRDTRDYELAVPLTIMKRDLFKLDEELKGRREYCLRSLYCNTYPQPVFSISGVRIEQWSHYDDPKSAALFLEDTCYAHERCLQWLAKKLPNRSPYERAA